MNRMVLALFGALLVLISFLESQLAASPRPSAVAFVSLQLSAGIIYLAAVHLVLKRPGGIRFHYVLLVGIACRLILLPLPPLFDDDIHRYLWDGRVLIHGINPFLYPPSAPELAPFRDANWTQIGYPGIRTIYPPLAQLLFGAAYAVGLRTILGLKALFFLFDFGTPLLIAALLRRWGRPRSWALIYAWSPLATKEFSNSGHLEPVMLFFLLLAFYFWLRAKPKTTAAGLALGAALLTKFVPVLLLPLVFRLGKWKSLAWSASLVLALYLPFAGAGKLLFSGASAYSRHWVFNPSAFAIFAWLEARLLPSGFGFPISLSRLLVALAVVGFALYLAKRLDVSDMSDILRSARNVLAAFLLLSPTVDPWYVCWLLPFLCFAPSAGLLAFTVTCSLSYLYYLNSAFPTWIPLLEYAPVYGLLLLGACRRKLARAPIATRARGITPLAVE